nr:dachshund-1 [Phrynus marginemaculatus]
MDGSSGEGTTSPSADMSSPPSLQTSPNPDSSGLLGDSVANSGGSTALLGPSGTISPKTGQPVSAIAGLCSPGTAGLGPPRTSPTSPPGAILPPVVVSKPYTPPMSTAPTVGLSSGCSKHEPGHNPHTSHVTPMGLIGNTIRNGAPSHPAVSVGGYGLSAPRLERPIHPVSPPGIPTDATANDCRLIDYRGAKVAAFYVNGDYLLCLPQAFELFLKHLVGGLHTVYTKLKRLDITPIVCNVEQVRILRGLGAIQPGVNRCKLLSCKDFDVLYKDCTTARPGRPPKRATMVGMNHASPNHSMLLKKSRLDGDYSGYENGHIAGERLDKAHMLPNGYSHHAAAQAAMAAAAASGAPPHINPLPFMALNHASTSPHQSPSFHGPQPRRSSPQLYEPR